MPEPTRDTPLGTMMKYIPSLESQDTIFVSFRHDPREDATDLIAFSHYEVRRQPNRLRHDELYGRMNWALTVVEDADA